MTLRPCVTFGPDDPLDSLPAALLVDMAIKGDRAAEAELDRRARLDLDSTRED